MKTAINGKVRLKWFWRGLYSGSGMTPIERVFTIGRLTLAKVVYAKYDPFTKDYYRKDVLDILRNAYWYDVRWEEVPHGGDMWHYVYSTIDGGHVDRPEGAYRLLQNGIVDIQKMEPKNKVCSIGFHPVEQKWYGWSHRARYGFGIGDVVKEGDCCASSGWTDEYLKDHPDPYVLPVGFEAKTLKDAKTMAKAFANSVG